MKTRQSIPISPKRFAKVVNQIIRSATPKKAAELEKHGVNSKRNLESVIATEVTHALQNKEMQGKRMTEQGGRTLVKKTHGFTIITMVIPWFYNGSTVFRIQP